MQIQSHTRPPAVQQSPLRKTLRKSDYQPEPASIRESLPTESVNIKPASPSLWRGLQQTASALAEAVVSSLTNAQPEPGSQLKSTPLPPFNSNSNPRWASKLTDIMQHEAPGDHNPYNDLITKGHETIHGIDNWLMNNGQPPDGGDGRWHLQSGFYLGDNKGVVIWEPDMKKHQVAEHVPRSLRGSRYKHYIEGARAWDDHPLYVWQEWNGYINGTEVGLNQKAEGKWTAGRRIAALGPMEFTVYGLATAKAIKQNDPQRWNSDPQFREFMAHASKRAMEAANLAQQTNEFNHPNFDEYQTAFRNSPDAASLRAFAKDELGEAFCKKVFGF